MFVKSRRKSHFKIAALVVVAIAIVAYFSFHAFSGRYGLTAYRSLETEVGTLEKELASLKLERADLEHHLSLLQSKALDQDLIEEQARVNLGYVHPHDVVIFFEKKQGALRTLPSR